MANEIIFRVFGGNVSFRIDPADRAKIDSLKGFILSIAKIEWSDAPRGQLQCTIIPTSRDQIESVKQSILAALGATESDGITRGLGNRAVSNPPTVAATEVEPDIIARITRGDGERGRVVTAEGLQQGEIDKIAEKISSNYHLVISAVAAGNSVRVSLRWPDSGQFEEALPVIIKQATDRIAEVRSTR